MYYLHVPSVFISFPDPNTCNSGDSNGDYSVGVYLCTNSSVNAQKNAQHRLLSQIHSITIQTHKCLSKPHLGTI